MRTWNAMDNYMDFYDTWTGFLYWIQYFECLVLMDNTKEH